VRKGYIVVTPLAEEIHRRARASGRSLALHAEVDAELGKHYHNLGTALQKLPKGGRSRSRRAIKVNGDVARHSAFVASFAATGTLPMPPRPPSVVERSAGAATNAMEGTELLAPAPRTPPPLAMRRPGRSPSPEVAPRRRRCRDTASLGEDEKEKYRCLPMSGLEGLGGELGARMQVEFLLGSMARKDDLVGLTMDVVARARSGQRQETTGAPPVCCERPAVAGDAEESAEVIMDWNTGRRLRRCGICMCGDLFDFEEHCPYCGAPRGGGCRDASAGGGSRMQSSAR